MSGMCEDKWVFQSLVYWDSHYPKPGRSDYDRYYADKYYCEKCLSIAYRNERIIGTNWDVVLPGAVRRY